MGIAACLLVHATGAHCAPPGIEGRWATVDESTQARRSIVEITRDGQRVIGRIVEIYPKPGEDPDPTCDRCTGVDRGQKIRGLAILRLEADADGLRFKGTVLDPELGKVYQGAVTLDEGGARLRLRGYVGLPIFGRTENWSRLD